jgi:hypothetical protein
MLVSVTVVFWKLPWDTLQQKEVREFLEAKKAGVPGELIATIDACITCLSGHD